MQELPTVRKQQSHNTAKLFWLLTFYDAEVFGLRSMGYVFYDVMYLKNIRYPFFVHHLLYCNYRILAGKRYLAEKNNFSLKIMNLLYYAGPVLSTYQSFRLPYFTPLLPNNAIILASNLGWLSWVEPTPPTYTAPEQG
jgi:hypothetical protein